MYHVGQLGLRHLEDRLVELQSSSDEFVPMVAERSLELMRASGPGA
jgi:hypothetical protein